MFVCSGMHPAGFAQYGHRFLESFHAFWPRRIDLAVYTEERIKVPRGECRSVFDCRGIKVFQDSIKNNLEARGKEPRRGWREKDRQAGYCFRFDVSKFHKQLFIPEHAAESLPDGEILVWLDADVFTSIRVPDDLVEGMLGDADLCYLGRPGTHSELGFWAVRLNQRSRKFLFDLAEIHRSGAVFGLAEWHSAYVHDHCRVQNERLGLKAHNITPNGRRHVWFQAPIGKYADHVKGPMRKALGYSPVKGS